MNKCTTYTVDVICAWCKKVIGRKGGFTSNEPTHGICKECCEKEMEKFGVNDE